MAEITRYVLVDADDNEQEFEFERFDDAKYSAEIRGGLAVIERHYVYQDSELVWTPDGTHGWPPRKKAVTRG